MGRGDVEMLSLDGGVGVKRTTVLEMLNLIMTKRHQAIEETEYWYYLGKNANCELPWLLQFS